MKPNQKDNKQVNEQEIARNRMILQHEQSKLLVNKSSQDKLKKTHQEKMELKVEKFNYRIEMRRQNPLFCKRNDIYTKKVVI